MNSLAAAILNKRKSRSTSQSQLVAVLLFALVALALASVSFGAVGLSPQELLSILAAQIGLKLPWEFTATQESIVVFIRLPRTLFCILLGAGLAASGAAIQGLFRNPLADPALIGISNGAACGAVFFIVIGGGLFGATAGALTLFLTPAAAFLGGLAATWLVFRISTRNNETSVTIMILGGIAINAMAAAFIGLMMFVADDDELRTVTFWLLGNIAGAGWKSIGIAALFILPALLALTRYSSVLDAMMLGEREARHLGFDVERGKFHITFLTAIIVGAAVSLAGVIGFIGLVVPHIVRLLVGSHHQRVIPLSILSGGILLLLSDLAARLVAAPAEMPVGILTSAIGGPFFLWLLLRFKRNRSLM